MCRLQSRLTESYPLSCLLEPQLIPYSLSDIPLYSDNPDSSDTLVTTLTEDVMLVSPADFYSLLKHLHSHPNNVIKRNWNVEYIIKLFLVPSGHRAAL